MQVDQLEAVLVELHSYRETARVKGALVDPLGPVDGPRVGGLGGGGKMKDFDEQDAREAEEQLGHVLRERAREAKARGSGGGTGIDYRTFDEWKRKYEEQKEQNSGLNMLG